VRRKELLDPSSWLFQHLMLTRWMRSGSVMVGRSEPVLALTVAPRQWK
jgi:hypothetical protein